MKKQNESTNNSQYCTLESTSPAASCTYSSPSYESPVYLSCLTEDLYELNPKLEQESLMLSPYNDFVHSLGSYKLVLPVIPRDLKQALIACARAVADGVNLAEAEWLMTELRHMVSVSGEPLQRLGAYMLEGLVARLSSSGHVIYRSLKCSEPLPPSSDLLSYMHILYEVCPYFKFGYISANGAIAEAVKHEDMIHIIDFQIAQGSQWLTLIQALAARPGGPPRLRITGIDDSVSSYARGGGLHLVGQRLSSFARSCELPFEFHRAFKALLEKYCQNYRLEERDGALYLGWINRALVVSSAWR